jgi:Flp pilus assembly protein TadD
MGYQALSLALVVQGETTEALVAVDKGSQLDPRHNYTWAQGWAYSQQGRVEQAISAFKRYLADSPNNFWVHARLAGEYMELGQDDAGRAEAAEALRLNPQLTVEMIAPTGSVLDKGHPTETERFRAALRKAGLK